MPLQDSEPQLHIPKRTPQPSTGVLDKTFTCHWLWLTGIFATLRLLFCHGRLG